MKTITTIICLILIINQGFSQIKPEKWKPAKITTTPHDPNFKSRLKSTATQSFYKSKDNWQEIIDSIWGPGQSLNTKLNIFNTYTQRLTEKFDGFNSLGIDPTEWDSIKTVYRSKINDSTSRGAFAALMGHLAYNLRDGHTWAWDTIVLNTPLNPGVPILVIGSQEADRFGAVLTLSTDSTLVVLRTVENHPLDLQPGDIVLGYEGIPWKDLIDELLESGIPFFARPSGAISASRHNELISAGYNWHLFDSMDIIKYAGGDTLHLSVYPLLDLPVRTGSYEEGGENLMLNFEQLPVPGVPFPDAGQFHERGLTYGIVEGTNIGYIYLYVEAQSGYNRFTYSIDPQFYEAISSLIETEGLIIDLRLNRGGWAEYKDAEALLFNQHMYTLESAYRCNTSDFSLCPSENYTEFEISGDPNSIYDRPIAVLIGPGCVSMGDITTYLMGYHPMVHFFGKPTNASMGWNEWIENVQGWDLHYSMADVVHIGTPGSYLNRREFPVDVPVWFNADDAANGVDPVVEKAIKWMQNLSYTHDVSVERTYVVPGTGTASITAQVENPNNHSISVKAHITDIDGLMVDSTTFFDDGNHNDGDPGDGTWGAWWSVPSVEEIYSVSVITEDTIAGSLRTLPQVVLFTTIGPVTVENITFTHNDTIPNPGDKIYFEITLRNNDPVTTATNIKTSISVPDSNVSFNQFGDNSYGDISPGGISTTTGYCRIEINSDYPYDTEIPVYVDIASDGYPYWKDTLYIPVYGMVNIEDIQEPIVRIYPNPTENILNIDINNTGKKGFEIEIFTFTGSLIYRKEYKNINSHFVEQIDLSGYTKGIYLIKVRQADTVYFGKVVVR